MKLDAIEIQIKSLPEVPGVYQYYDKQEKIIYIGKAKNLKKRVSSYFNRILDNHKTRLLVKNINRIEHVVVDSEMDALLLENNLIKKYKPRYNILLKDDKTYPWICLEKQPKPKIFFTRNITDKSREYFGPFTSVKHLKILIQLIKETYPFLNQELNHLLKINNKESSIFLFDKHELSIKQLINGNLNFCINHFKKEMKVLSNELKFEEAQVLKEKINALVGYQAKSTIVNPKISNVDVFSIISDESHGYINYLQVSFGAIVRSHTIEIKKKLDEKNESLLQLGIIEIRQLFSSISKTLFLSQKVSLGEELKVFVPQQGDKKKLVDLSIRNAKYFRIDRYKQMKITDPDRHTNRIMSQMKVDLRLPKEPIHIECFDNSNIQGSNPVAACIVFKNGKPSKKEYRHYNIKTVNGPDDFASMEEVVFRRYKRLLEEDASLPQLIVIDGGKGQLSSAVKSLDILGLRGKISILGIAKRLEEIYFPNDSIPLYLDKKSESLKILQRARDEAHRFGIIFHRQKRSKSSLTSKLDVIPGIGPATREKLLSSLKSFKRIKSASKREVINILGKEKGARIYEALQKN
ncbi:MAG: excinuclease ABC subunit UvrC [Flavobacteriaceae bacterium]|nr:excinuclease ABC subunit UvrC [Flavobacteriaceae bacterium]MDG2235569.1 excinuclease ABC subunit UvrC [Flavobacteriaceae bacterium]